MGRWHSAAISWTWEIPHLRSYADVRILRIPPPLTICVIYTYPDAPKTPRRKKSDAAAEQAYGGAKSREKIAERTSGAGIQGNGDPQFRPFLGARILLLWFNFRCQFSPRLGLKK